jgi:putative two-component system response regulator
MKSAVHETIMVVDDMAGNLQLLGDMLRQNGYRVLAFPSGRLALRAATRKPPDLILLDINMPEMDGYDVCRSLKQASQTRDVPVLFISAMSATDDKLAAFAAGGLDYVTKPFQYDEVLARVATHLRLHRLQLEREEYATKLESMVAEQVQEISDSQVATIRGLAKLAESRDDDTGLHIDRTRAYCRLLAETLQRNSAYASEISPAYVKTIYEAAALHDIGKVGISDLILLKKDKLTAGEFETMKLHVSVGAETLREVCERYPKNDYLKMGRQIAEFHHERWDGTGYGSGLAGEQIPLCGRIMAVADVYDALRSARPYKSPFSHEKAATIIRSEIGTHFDPTVVAAFNSVEGEFHAISRVAFGK